MSDLLNILSDYETLLFDLDGTLFSQIDYDRKVFEDFFQDEGIATTLAQFKSSMGYGHPNVFNLFTHAHPELEFSIEELIHFYRNHLPDLGKVPTLAPLLSNLSSKRMIVVTNGPEKRQRHKLQTLGLEKFFEQTIILDPCRNDPLKPSPQSFFTITPSPQKPVMIGDQRTIDGTYALKCQIPFIFFQFSTDISPKE